MAHTNLAKLSSSRTICLIMVGPHSSNCPGLLYLECKAALDDTSSGTCQKKRHLIIERFEDNLGTNALVRIKDDYKPGSSVDDCQFLKIIDEAMIKDRESGSRTTALPLCMETKCRLDNRENTLKRLKSTCRLLDRKTTMKEHYFTFVLILLNSSYVEIAPVSEPKQPTMWWYLLHFGV